MEDKQQIKSQKSRENSSLTPIAIWANLAISILLGFLGIGWIRAESFTTLDCQRDGSGYCEITGMRMLNQNAKHQISLDDISHVTYESPAESEQFNLLITQTEEYIRLNGFSAEQAQTIQSFIDDPSQQNLALHQPYDRRPYAAAIGGLFFLVGAGGVFDGLRKLTGAQ